MLKHWVYIDIVNFTEYSCKSDDATIFIKRDRIQSFTMMKRRIFTLHRKTTKSSPSLRWNDSFSPASLFFIFCRHQRRLWHGNLIQHKKQNVTIMTENGKNKSTQESFTGIVHIFDIIFPCHFSIDLYMITNIGIVFSGPLSLRLCCSRSSFIYFKLGAVIRTSTIEFFSQFFTNINILECREQVTTWKTFRLES